MDLGGAFDESGVLFMYTPGGRKLGFFRHVPLIENHSHGAKKIGVSVINRWHGGVWSDRWQAPNILAVEDGACFVAKDLWVSESAFVPRVGSELRRFFLA